MRQKTEKEEDRYQTTYFLHHKNPLFLYKRNLSYLSMTLIQSKPRPLIIYWNNGRIKECISWSKPGEHESLPPFAGGAGAGALTSHRAAAALPPQQPWPRTQGWVSQKSTKDIQNACILCSALPTSGLAFCHCF